MAQILRCYATAPVRPLAWEPPFDAGVALKKTKTQDKKTKKKKKKDKKKERKRTKVRNRKN